ncbi:MAG: hypothetical protein IJ087_06480 [Eggerthellaceae bacterium]|nr:hypothetical protein [Eggerthellaceae bacterium]
MKTFLSHETALDYWRRHFPLDSELGAPARVSGAEDCASCKKDVAGSVPEELVIPGSPIDVLVFNVDSRRRSSSVACHVWQTRLPQNSFYRTRGVYVSSPEFVFLQMASVLPIEQLVALGCELCGRYVLLPKGATHLGSIDAMPTRLTPLTSTTRIASFLESAGKAKGKAKAKRALKYVVDDSRSPMETITYMLLCLPVMLGGYGLPKPEMNAPIELDDEARSIAHRRHCEGDLCWPSAKLDIEYHGEVHVGAAQMKSDVGRELGIEHMGWRVITVTSPQVFDADHFETVAKEAASCLRKRLRAAAFEATAQRMNLRYELERWMPDLRGRNSQRAPMSSF